MEPPPLESVATSIELERQVVERAGARDPPPHRARHLGTCLHFATV